MTGPRLAGKTTFAQKWLEKLPGQMGQEETM